MKTFKYRLYPSKHQKTLLNKTFGCVRFVFNQMLNDKIEYYEANHENLSVKSSNYKNNYEWLKEVDSQALCSAWVNLKAAFDNFFKHPDKFGFPNFKSKKDHNQTFTTYNLNNCIRIDSEHNLIKIPKIGWVKIRLHRSFDGNIKHITVRKTPSGQYYVSILSDIDTYKCLEPSNKQIGLDLGLKEFLVGSDGSVIHAPKYYREAEAKLKKLQKQLDRCQKPKETKHKPGDSIKYIDVKPSNYEKVRIKLAKQHQKVANQRKDFLHKLSSKIINENQVIVIEDLKVKNMIQNKNLSKSIQDVGWSMFVGFLKYKAEWYRKQIIQVSQWYPSSQTCSNCGCINKEVKNLSVRHWICPECCVEHERDLNASINILKEGLRILNESNYLNKIKNSGDQRDSLCKLVSKTDIEQEAYMSLAYR